MSIPPNTHISTHLQFKNLDKIALDMNPFVNSSMLHVNIVHILGSSEAGNTI